MKKKNWISNWKSSPMLLIGLAFLFVILLGSLLLFFPFTHKSNSFSIEYIDALFTSISATCVTGLVSIKEGVADTFNIFGYVIIAILIQIGGFGAAMVGVSIFIIFARKLSFQQQNLIKESWNISNYKGLKRIFLLIVLTTFVFELIGATLLFLDFYFLHNEIGGGDNFALVGYSVFTSISAFNNAGFDLFGTTSLISFQNDIWLNLIIAFLIIFGGLGYLVIFNILSKKFNFKRFRFDAKVAVFMTFILIVFGTLIIYGTENLITPNTSFTSGNKSVNFLGAFFLSVSTRTAGFTTYDLSCARNSTLLIMMVLMFIGACPGGTGGGIKTTTVFVTFIHFISMVSKKPVHAFERSVSKKVINRALTLMFVSMLLIILSVFLISTFEGNMNFIKDGVIHKEYVEDSSLYGLVDYLFEVFSAFATVGLSTGYTPYFTNGSKIVLMFLMFLGRLGPLSISQIVKSKEIPWNYVEEDVSIG